MPVLLKTALALVQFETIHPFLDGNGRLGRLLIALLLHQGGLLTQPLLYLSLYLKQHRPVYYDLLDRVRTIGDWEAWVDFFLEGVEATALGAVDTASRLVALFNKDTRRLQQSCRSAANALRVLPPSASASHPQPPTHRDDLPRRQQDHGHARPDRYRP